MSVQAVNPWIAVMVERIVHGFAPRRILLFGSQARGEARADSDVDLLVVLDHVDDKRKSAVAMRVALTGIPVAKDIVVTTPDEIAARGSLVGSILRPALNEGRLVYERP